jgi:Ser/Thr protein kinase RdoA (MazF antagonist)
MLKLDDILDQLAKSYCFDKLTIIENIVSWGGTLRLKIAANNQEFFLKEKVSYLNTDEFKKKTLLHKVLFDSGAPVVPVLLNSNGMPYTQIENQFFEILPWIKGKPIKRNTKDLEKLATNMGKFQIYSTNNFSRLLNNDQWDYPLQRQILFPDKSKNIQEYFNFFFSCKISNSFESNLINQLLELNNKILGKISWSKLDASWIHGDPGLDNSINYKNNVLFFDLDNIRLGYRIWDISRLCAFLGSFRIINGSVRELYQDWNQEQVSALIKGFNSVIKLNRIEHTHLPYLIGIHTIMNFIAEFDIDDSFDPTFKLLNLDINNELRKLIHLVQSVNILKLDLSHPCESHIFKNLIL